MLTVRGDRTLSRDTYNLLAFQDQKVEYKLNRQFYGQSSNRSNRRARFSTQLDMLAVKIASRNSHSGKLATYKLSLRSEPL